MGKASALFSVLAAVRSKATGDDRRRGLKHRRAVGKSGDKRAHFPPGSDCVCVLDHRAALRFRHFGKAGERLRILRQCHTEPHRKLGKPDRLIHHDPSAFRLCSSSLREGSGFMRYRFGRGTSVILGTSGFLRMYMSFNFCPEGCSVRTSTIFRCSTNGLNFVNP